MSKILIVVAAVLLMLPLRAMADAEVSDWIGTYNMNHDGHVGTLDIHEIKADCASSPWCAMALKYTDSSGQGYTARIDKIDDKNQHMVFYINFPNNTQKFDGYLFSWDKTKMAGTTYWGGRTFGFYAVKR